MGLNFLSQTGSVPQVFRQHGGGREKSEACRYGQDTICASTLALSTGLATSVVRHRRFLEVVAD